MEEEFINHHYFIEIYKELKERFEKLVKKPNFDISKNIICKNFIDLLKDIYAFYGHKKIIIVVIVIIIIMVGVYFAVNRTSEETPTEPVTTGQTVQ